MQVVGEWWEIDRDGDRANVRVSNAIGIHGDDGAALIEKLRGVRAVVCRIDSNGGCSHAALALAEALENRDTTVLVTGRAFSAAAIVALGGNRRLTEPTAEWMIHSPSRAVVGTASDLRFAAKGLDRIRNRFIDFITRRTGQTRYTVTKWIAGDFYMNATEAIALGFAHDAIEASAAPAAPFVYSESSQPKTEDEALCFSMLSALGQIQVRDARSFIQRLEQWARCHATEIDSPLVPCEPSRGTAV